MKQWFFHRQGSDQDWQILVNYFDEDNKRELPERLLLKFHEAMDCYKQCYEWYSRLNKEKLRAQLQNRRDYQLVLEEYSSLC